MARVKAALAGSALRGLDPRHALPESLGIYRSVGEEPSYALFESIAKFQALDVLRRL